VVLLARQLVSGSQEIHKPWVKVPAMLVSATVAPMLCLAALKKLIELAVPETYASHATVGYASQQWAP
jgi:hypothetical protein